jgi:hypothetical protein
MSSVHCTNCGHELRDVEHTPCPQCGDTRRTVNLEARVKVTSSVRAHPSLRRFEEEIRKNWPLIGVLAFGDLLSTIPAYFLNGWASVAVTLLFIMVSTIVGYYAVTRVVTITIIE